MVIVHSYVKLPEGIWDNPSQLTFICFKLVKTNHQAALSFGAAGAAGYDSDDLTL